jgi:signal transduction histidine kinase
VLLAVGLSYAVARTITRPLAGHHGDDARGGGHGRPDAEDSAARAVGVADEDARLLATTFNTLTDSVARFQREASLKERLLSLGRLSTVIAHEVRNPLMIIKAALRSLRPEAPAIDIREAVKDIDEEVDRLNRIVHDVLDFAKPPSMLREPADLVRLCQDAASAATVGGGAGDRSRDARVAPDGVDRSDRLRTALVNVLSNARQAVDARGPIAVPPVNGHEPPAVLLSLDRVDERHVRLRVSDQGTGIKSEHMSQVFEPYFTTRRTGTGLGLPIARNIVEGLGGTIGVATAPWSHDGRDHPATMTTTGTILLVDDEEKILKTLGRALRDEGHRVGRTRRRARGTQPDRRRRRRTSWWSTT